LKKHNHENYIRDYKVYVIEVDGSLSTVIDLFVKINSTGKALTSAEKQHAKFYNSDFLKTCSIIAEKNKDYFAQNKIISSSQISRMKHVELICELMISIHQSEMTNKKSALDKVMDKNSLTKIQINIVKQKTLRAINKVSKMFPKLKETRFKQLSDYFVLVFLISKYEAEGLVLTKPKVNRIAWDILKAFATGVDIVRDKQKKLDVPVLENEQMYRDYLVTVTSNTDDKNHRNTRLRILDSLLKSLFEIKDTKRLFSPEQRRLIWNTSDQKVCSKCKRQLNWDDFTLDHITPHSKGGKSELNNAALMCQKCNSSKGNRV
jgi:hypothetical protein